MPGHYDRVVYEVPDREGFRSSNSYLGRDSMNRSMDSGSANGGRYRGAESYLSSGSSFATRYGQTNSGSSSYQSRGSYGSSAGYGGTSGSAMGASYSRGMSGSYASGSSLGSVSRFDGGSRGYGGSSAYEGTSGYSSNSSGGYGSISSHGGASTYRGGVTSPWQGGGLMGSMGSRGDGILPAPRATSVPMRQTGGSNIAGAVSQLKQMANPESELALDILNAVLAQQGGEDTRRDWGGAPPNKMRRMEWDEGHGMSRGRTVSPSMRAPAMRKFPQQVWDNEPPQLAMASRPYSSAGHQMMANDPFRRVAKARRGKPNRGPANQQRGRSDGAASGAAKTSEGQKRKISDGDSSATAGPKKSNSKGDGKNEAAASDTSVEDIPKEALKCHMCNLNEFVNVGSYVRHLQSKEHSVSTNAFHTHGAAVLQLLRHEAKLVAQRNIVKGRLNTKGKNQNLPYCAKCQCRIFGSMEDHQRSIEHMLINQYMRVKCCGRMYSIRGELEEHRLTLQHLKLHDKLRIMKLLPPKSNEEAEVGTEDVTEEEALDMFREAVIEHQVRNKEQPFTPDTLPPYEPSKPIGMHMLGVRSHYRCKVCPDIRNKMETEEHVIKHFRSIEHYQNTYNYLVVQQYEKKKESDERRKEAAKKKAEEAEANAKNGEANDKGEEMEVTADAAEAGDKQEEKETKTTDETEANKVSEEADVEDEEDEDEDMKETENDTEGEGKEAMEGKDVGEGGDENVGEDEAAVEANEDVEQEENDGDALDEDVGQEEQEEGGEEHAIAEEAMDEVGEELGDEELEGTEDAEEEEEL